MYGKFLEGNKKPSETYEADSIQLRDGSDIVEFWVRESATNASLVAITYLQPGQTIRLIGERSAALRLLNDARDDPFRAVRPGSRDMVELAGDGESKKRRRRS